MTAGAVDAAGLGVGLAEVLAAHWIAALKGGCRCGWQIDLTDAAPVSRQHCAHVAAEVASWFRARLGSPEVVEAVAHGRLRHQWLGRGCSCAEPVASEDWQQHVDTSALTAAAQAVLEDS